MISMKNLFSSAFYGFQLHVAATPRKSMNGGGMVSNWQPTLLSGANDDKGSLPET
jgi:hypothetical protein